MTIKSLKDAGYQQAKVGDSLTALAQFALDTIAGFPKDLPAEARTELYAGYQLRYNETHPAELYAVINGHYTLATVEQLSNKKVEKIEVGVAYAFSYSSQEFGKLANTNPALHKLVKVWRDDTNDYCSNRLGDLKRAATKLLNKGKETQRQTLDFAESVKKAFDQLEKSVKVKSGRGDTTADAVKFKTAVGAFWKAYKV
jgi:hypothetical protein